MIFLGMVFGLVQTLAPMQTGKDEFVFGNEGEVESVDPAFETGVPDNTIVVQIFEGLLSRKADWIELIPGLAEKLPTISKDGKTYTFKLRPNLKWSDGTPLTAKDFEYSWVRAIDPKTLADYAYWLTNSVVGAAEYNKNPTPENAKKVMAKAIDDRTFVVNLKKVTPSFSQICSLALTYPVKKEVVEKWKEQWTRPEHIVGTGPYKMVEWKVQDKIVMEKNPYYYDADKVKIPRVVALPITDRQTVVNLFKQGKLDWSGRNGSPNALVPSFKSDPQFRVHPSATTYLYWINTSNPPLNDKRVRQALTLAIDRKQLVENVTRGGEIPAGFFVPQNLGHYKSPTGIVSNDHKADLEKAKKLLAEAGFPGGKGMRPLKIQYNSDENHKKIALTVQQMWKRDLGVETVLTNLEWKVYLQEQRAMNFDFSRGGWQADYPDPGTFLEILTPGSENNHTRWKNAKYGEIFDRANSMMDETKRNKVLAEAEKLMLEEAPIIPFYTYTNFGFLRPEIAGFTPNLVDQPFVRYMSKK
ncbi:MAG: transporter substrate-binding protein [Bacteriovoracaceae bacterium]|nr:transporter substrate-binding protein [Bacteriovoracaceae bacterium]